MHLAHEVGTIKRNEKKSCAEEGLAHEGSYQVEEAQFIKGSQSYNFKLSLNLPTHYTLALSIISYMVVGHSKVQDLCRIFNNNMLHRGSKDNSIQGVR